MKNKIVDRYIYNDFGFPIVLLHVPMKHVFGEWVLDIDLNKLQKGALNTLVRQPYPLTGKELRFIRKYFEMTVINFGKLLGVTHAAVLKWENEKSHLSAATENYIRLYVLDSLHARDKEFRQFFKENNIESLSEQRKYKGLVGPIEINAEDHLIVNS